MRHAHAHTRLAGWAGACASLSRRSAARPGARPAPASAAAQGFTVDHSDVKEFTAKVLKWWACADKSRFPTWALAARIVFAFTPSAAASERVFSLLKNMFGADQKACLADYIQAALMRAYNKRKVG